MPNKLFDLISESNYPLGKSVQANLEHLLIHCSEYLSEEEQAKVSHLARLAGENHSGLAATRAGSHPLASRLNESPIYVGLSAAGDTSPKLAPIRLLLVVAHLRQLSISKSHLKSAANLLSRLSYGDYSDAKAISEGLGQQPSKWAEGFDFEKHANSKRTPEVEVVWSWLKTLRQQQSSAQKLIRDRPARRPQSAVFRGRAIAVYESEKDPDSNAVETFPIVDPDVPPEKQFNPEANAGAIALAKSDSFLRLNRKYSGDSLESMPPGVCIELVELLHLGYSEANEVSEKSAYLLWLLAFSTGRPIDSLVRVIAGKSNNNETLVDVAATDDRVVQLRLLHPLSDDVPDLGDLEGVVHGEASKEATFAFRFNRLEAVPACVKYIREGDHVEQALLSAKQSVRGKLRERLDWATEKTLRGSVIQQVIFEHQDDPLAQLVFDELLNMSRASLHYLSYPTGDIATIWTQALGVLAGDDCIVVEACSRAAFGAPRSLVAHDVFMSELVGENLCFGDKNKPEDRHQAFLSATSACFMFGTGHRPNKHLLEVVRDDICLSVGLAVIYDKPNATDRIRRLVVLPSLTIQWLKAYVANLESLLSTPALSDEFRQCVKAALSGAGPLFISLPDSPNALEVHAAAVGLGLYRHHLSQFIRDQGASALLREMHMGHQPVQPLFGPNGYVSPDEAGKELRPYLDDWMVSIGFPEVPEHALPKACVRIADKTLLEALRREARKREKAQVMALLKANLKAGAEWANSNYLEGALDELTKGALSTGKTNVTLGEAETREIVRRLAGQYGGNLNAIQASIRNLRKKLRRLKQERKWDVFFPEPAAYLAPSPVDITAAHLQAAETVAEIGRRLTNHSYPAAALRLHTQLALILWAGCSTFKEADSWLDAFRGAKLDKYSSILTADLRPENDSDRAPSCISVSGRALIFVFAYLSVSRVSKQAGVTVLDELELSKPDVEFAANLSRPVLYPGCQARAINSPGHTTELDQRKLAVLEGNVQRNEAPLLEPPVLEAAPTRADKAAPSENRKCIRKLQSCISEAGSNKAAIKAVRQLIDSGGLPFIEYWLAIWALDLLSVAANVRTGGELRRETVAGYLHDVFVPLCAIKFDESFVDEENDEIADLLDAALSEEPAQRQEQAQRLTRFFASVGPSMGIPKLTLTYEGVETRVDANIISKQEYAETQMVLGSWLECPELQARYVNDIKAAIEIIPLYETLGARRRELSELRAKDWIAGGGENYVFIRHTDWRSLKTKGSKRLLRVETSQPRTSKYVFEALTQELGRSLGLDVATAALRAVGDPGARIHHFRHTRATREYLTIAKTKKVFDRVRGFAGLSAGLGHASIATTLHYYVHVVGYGLAQKEQGSEELFSGRALCSLLSLKPDYLRQKRRRAKKNGHPLSVELTRKLQNNKQAEKSKRAKDARGIALPIGLGGTKKKESLSLRNVASWHQLYFGGESATRAAGKSALDLLSLDELLRSGLSLSKQIGWKIYPYTRAKIDVDLLNREGAYADHHREVTRKKVWQHQFTADIGALRHVPSQAGHLISLHLSQVDWKTRKPLAISIPKESATQINAEFKAFNLPLELEPQQEQVEMTWLVRSTKREVRDSKYENYFVRFFLFSVLVFNDLAHR